MSTIPSDSRQADERARALVAAMTLDEKLHQLSGDISVVPEAVPLRLINYNRGPFPSGADEHHGIPPLQFVDGPRGVVIGASTAFPVSMARGASWDPGLEERIGDAIGVEMRSQGGTLFGGVCINLLRHPGWGRAQETYGEDTHLLGEMGAALVRGIQRHGMACIKHYACNSIENSRFKVDVRIDERTLREVYLPHFKRCVDEGAAVVMTAYNRVNGQRCGHHVHLNREILKGEWGFCGFTLSDFVLGVSHPVAGIKGGLDVEMPFPRRYGRRLKKAVRRGEVDEALIDEAAERVIATKLRFADVGEPARYRSDAVASQEHRALAYEAAVRSMVLLRNEPVDGTPVLPLEPAGIGRVAVVGALAEERNIGDRGSSMVSPPAVVTPLAGFRAALGGRHVLGVPSDDPEEAAEVARRADAAVVVVGLTHRDEGEYVMAWGGDRTRLELSEDHERLITAVAAANPRTAVVVMAGSAVITEAWRERVPAIVMAWYPGMEGGRALVDLLTGAESFSGKLPCSFPKDAADLPPFDPTAREVTYSFLHGYRLLQAEGAEPAFPFGHGLSYTSYEYGPLALEAAQVAADGLIEVTVEVRNVGARDGEEIVQLYVGAEDSAVQRAPLDLRAFERVHIPAGQARTVHFSLPAERLAYYDVDTGAWTVEPTTYQLAIGPSSDPETHHTATVRVGPAAD